MGPKISVTRKRDNVYLKLMGNFNPTSAHEILHAVEKMVTASLKFASPGSKVHFTFKAHAQVRLGKKAVANPREDTVLSAEKSAGRWQEGPLRRFCALI
jgi:hypothetical protein